MCGDTHGKISPNCGNELVKLHIPNYISDYMVATGNSLGMVKSVKIEPTDATKYLTVMMIWVQRIGKARNLHYQK
nr:MAG TPA: hypothetical protein [Caudoviricetes sp.]